MFPCPLCRVSFEKRKFVDIHLKDQHSENKTPYTCKECPSTFTSEKAAKLHVKKHHAMTPASADDDNHDGDRKRARVQECPFVGTVSEWIHARYNPSRSTAVEKLSQSTIDRIIAFSESVVFENAQTLLQILALADDGVIMDLIDGWVDTELQMYEMQTVNNHVRYLKVLLLCQRDHIDLPCVDDVVIEYIVDLVVDTQATTTRASTTLNMLKLEDPFALAAIRDAVVNALLKEQVEYIHPYLLQHVLPSRHAGAHVEFGIRLRNWLELVIRFTNIPCRIQCSRELQVVDPTAMQYVSKLVLRDGQYCRLINQDKTSSTHQPLLIPLGRSISSYLYLYMTYCRPSTDHAFVFCTRRGTKWSRPSRDLKRYMEDVLHIPVHEVDPTGRFIHGSRSIMMAVFAIGVDFDQQKMHGFARLMRHSSTTNERFYSMWQQRALSNQSIDVFSALMGLDFDSVSLTPAEYKPVRLRDVPPRMLSVFMMEFGTQITQSNVVPCYGTKSIGTQTGAEETVSPETALQEIDISDTQPCCRMCGLFSLELYGPFGSMRRKRYVGRYYLACSACHRNEDGRFNLPMCLWYPLGYTPVQKSHSSKPRNISQIHRFVDASVLRSG